MISLRCDVQIAEAALADEWVTHGDRLALQRRVLRLGKPPRRWRRPPWAAAALSEPREVCLVARPLTSVIGAFTTQQPPSCLRKRLLCLIRTMLSLTN